MVYKAISQRGSVSVMLTTALKRTIVCCLYFVCELVNVLDGLVQRAHLAVEDIG